ADVEAPGAELAGRGHLVETDDVWHLDLSLARRHDQLDGRTSLDLTRLRVLAEHAPHGLVALLVFHRHPQAETGEQRFGRRSILTDDARELHRAATRVEH